VASDDGKVLTKSVNFGSLGVPKGRGGCGVGTFTDQKKSHEFAGSSPMPSLFVVASFRKSLYFLWCLKVFGYIDFLNRLYFLGRKRKRAQERARLIVVVAVGVVVGVVVGGAAGLVVGMM